MVTVKSALAVGSAEPGPVGAFRIASSVADWIGRDVVGRDVDGDLLGLGPIDVPDDHRQQRHGDHRDDEQDRPQDEAAGPDADEELAPCDGGDVGEVVHDRASGLASVVASRSSAPTRSTKTSSSDGSATSNRRTSPPWSMAAWRSSWGSPPAST